MKIEFNQEKHEYTVDGKIVPSVTQVLKTNGLAPDYSHIPPSTLEKAAERGTLIHKAIEMHVKHGDIYQEELREMVLAYCAKYSEAPDEILKRLESDVNSFVELCKAHGLKPLYAEVRVSDGIIAGTIDVICENGEVIDVKTGEVLDNIYCTWQLTLYRHLYTDATRLFNCQLSSRKSKMIEVQPIAPDEVKSLIEAVKNDLYYIIEQPQLPAELVQTAVEKLKAVKYYEDLVKAAKKEIEEVEGTIKTLMAENNIRSYEAYDKSVKITYTPETTRKTFDSKKFKEICPDTYESYCTETKVKDRITITIRKETADE